MNYVSYHRLSSTPTIASIDWTPGPELFWIGILDQNHYALLTWRDLDAALGDGSYTALNAIISKLRRNGFTVSFDILTCIHSAAYDVLTERGELAARS